jgi:hypothetical protein
MAIVHQAAAPHRAQNPLPSPHPDQVLASYVYELMVKTSTPNTYAAG